MSWGEVVFDDGVRRLTTEVEGSPVLLPEATRIMRETPSRVEIAPVGGPGDDMPDVLVGWLPVVTRHGLGLRAEYLDLRPPEPFKKTDVSLMWKTLQASSAPLPARIGPQGRLDVADPSTLRAQGLEPEFLRTAHSTARALVAEWPQVEAVQHAWRPIDITAGREDERDTDKRAGVFPMIKRPDGTPRPTLSSRIVPTSQLWRSNQLAAMAREVLARIGRVDADRVPGLESPKLVAPFEAVARQAYDRRRTLERPLSTWPTRASAALTAFGALLSGVAPRDAGGTYAPLCHLWRLFEAWVALQVLDQLADDARLSLRKAPAKGSGDEWHAVFEGPNGRILVVAQPQVSRDPASCGILAPVGLFSVSSVLQPDLVVAMEDMHSGTWHVDVYDAKKRSQPMTSGDVAEAASKYVWGIRRKGSTADELAVRSVTIVTTGDGGSMFSPADSRIGSVCAMPSEPGVGELAGLLRERLDA